MGPDFFLELAAAKARVAALRSGAGPGLAAFLRDDAANTATPSSAATEPFCKSTGAAALVTPLVAATLCIRTRGGRIGAPSAAAAAAFGFRTGCGTFGPPSAAAAATLGPPSAVGAPRALG